MRDKVVSAMCGDYVVRGKRSVMLGAWSALTVVMVYKEGDDGVWVARAQYRRLSAMNDEEVEDALLEEAVHVLLRFIMEGFMEDWWDTLSTTLDVPVLDCEDGPSPLEPNGSEDC